MESLAGPFSVGSIYRIRSKHWLGFQSPEAPAAMTSNMAQIHSGGLMLAVC